MRPTVVDASAVIDALLPRPERAAALRALRDRELWAPAILDLEVLSAVARLERAGLVTPAEAGQAIDDLGTMPVERIEPARLTRGVWALRGGIRIADAFYVAAARGLEAELLTADARLARAPGLGVPVVLLPR